MDDQKSNSPVRKVDPKNDVAITAYMWQEDKKYRYIQWIAKDLPTPFGLMDTVVDSSVVGLN